jgi:hypothetical protein
MVTPTKFPREQLPLRKKKFISGSNFLEEEWIFPKEQLFQGEKDFLQRTTSSKRKGFPKLP